MGWLNRHVETMRIECGDRVLYYIEGMPRDVRWFRNLWEKARRHG